VADEAFHSYGNFLAKQVEARAGVKRVRFDHVFGRFLGAFGRFLGPAENDIFKPVE